MPKVKALLIASMVIALSFSLIGCNLLPSGSPETETMAGLESDLPGWLLLSHRSESDDDLDNPKEPVEEEEEDIEEEAAAETVAEEPSTEQPAQSSAPAQTEEPESSSFTEPKPGTREYLVWFAANGAKGEYQADMLEWYAKTQGGTTQSYAAWKEEQEEASDGTGGDGWFDDDSVSPSGWGD